MPWDELDYWTGIITGHVFRKSQQINVVGKAENKRMCLFCSNLVIMCKIYKKIDVHDDVRKMTCFMYVVTFCQQLHQRIS